MTWKKSKSIFSQLPPSRGREFPFEFNTYTQSPRGRGQGEGERKEGEELSP
jgi:hypothetical protein